ncbi:Hypothetical_protein [Hexamita inflata]|uniref:Hypothetical_protein n=1 Tax=Hexamita inflata TaxID=28002 RepID=A0AA86V0R8_9EUKA|nr:Hypothetical protein HINF_LOCUS59596 [Hexamita inflata]
MKCGIPIPTSNRLPPKLSQIPVVPQKLKQIPQNYSHMSYQESSRAFSSSRNNDTNDFVFVDFKARKLIDQLQENKKELIVLTKRFKHTDLFFEQTLLKNMGTINSNYNSIRQFYGRQK